MTAMDPLRRLCRFGAVALLAAALPACATLQMGSNFDLQAFKSQVMRGRTTKAQVEQWLGSPASTGVDVSTGGMTFDQWTYFYGKGKLGSMNNAQLKILQVKFDQDGVVRGYNYSTQAK